MSGRVAPPAIQVSSHPQLQVLDALIDGWRDGDTGEYYEEAMEIAEEVSPGATQTLLNLLAREDESGDEAVREYMTETFDAMQIYIIGGERSEARREFTNMNNGPFQTQITKAWAVGSVRGIYSGEKRNYDTLHDNDFIDGIEGTADMIGYDRNEINDPDFWRGMTALYFLNRDPDDDGPEMREFARWASKQDDLRTAIAVADDRGILKPSDIEAVLREKRSVESAISEGVL